MSTTHMAPTPARGQRISGWILTGLLVAFLLFDSIGKLMRPQMVVQASAQLGYSASALPTVGILLLAFTVLFVIPRTLFLGSLLLTAYLGGAAAAGIRLQRSAFDTLFPVCFCVLVWLAAFLREPRFRALLSTPR